jgi:hypothetical protein
MNTTADRMLVGEDDDIRYLGNGNDELHLVFNFPPYADGTHHTQPCPAQPKGAFDSARSTLDKRLAMQYAGQSRHFAHSTPATAINNTMQILRACIPCLVLTLKRHTFPLQRRRDRHDRPHHY